MIYVRRTLVAGLFGVALLSGGCAGFRDTTRSVFNTDRVETAASPLVGTDWVYPPGEATTPPELDGRWALIEFLDPG